MAWCVTHNTVLFSTEMQSEPFLFWNKGTMRMDFYLYFLLLGMFCCRTFLFVCFISFYFLNLSLRFKKKMYFITPKALEIIASNSWNVRRTTIAPGTKHASISLSYPVFNGVHPFMGHSFIRKTSFNVCIRTVYHVIDIYGRRHFQSP